MCAKISRVLCAFCLAFLLISCQSKESSSSVDKTKLTLMAEQVDGTSSYVMLVFEAGELSKWIDYQLISYYQFQTEEVNETYFRRIPVTSEKVMLNIPQMGNYMLVARAISEEGSFGETLYLPVIGAPAGFEVIDLSAIHCQYKVRIFEEGMNLWIYTDNSSNMYTEEGEGVCILGEGFPSSSTAGYVVFVGEKERNEYSFRLFSGAYDATLPLPEKPELQVSSNNLYQVELAITHSENTLLSLYTTLPKSELAGMTPEDYLKNHPEVYESMDYYMDSYDNPVCRISGDGSYVVMVVPLNRNGREGMGSMAVREIEIKEGKLQ